MLLGYTMALIKIEKPIKSGYTVYTRSGCMYCNSAKTLLQNCHKKKIINCDGMGHNFAFIYS
jgi:glutaredoxin